MRHLPLSRVPDLKGAAFSIVTALAIAFIGGSSSLFFVPVAHANNGLTVSASPSSGTLRPGQALTVNISDPTGTTDAVADACTVNGVDVASTFHNASPGAYTLTYTVGATDQSQAAGQVPINCTMHQSNSVTVTAFDDNNTIAIDTSADTGSGSGTGTTTDAGSGTGTTTDAGGGTGTTTDTGSGSGGGTITGPTQPALSSVAVSPSSGTLHAGDSAAVTFTESTGQTDLSLAGSCLINATDVSSSFANIGGGRYEVFYTVHAGHGERPAGHVPVSCLLGNSAGTVRASAWSDGNSVAIDTNDDGTIDNGTSTLGFTISATPSSGTLQAGGHLLVSFQDPLPSGDVVIGPMGCHVNNVNVAGSYAYHGNGLYTVDYAVGSTDQSRHAGQVPVDCQLQNATGSVHLVSFTDGNTVAIDTTASTTGGTGTDTTGSGGPSGISFAAIAVPNTGSRTAGQQFEVHLLESNHDSKVVLDGACTVNGVDVSSTFNNVTDGQYVLIYTVGASDTDRAAGQIPFACSLRESETGATTTVAGFTDGNTVSIDANGNGTIDAGTGGGSGSGSDGTIPYVASVTASPSSGTLSTGDQLQVFIQEGTHSSDFSPTACTINGQNDIGTFASLSNGLYRFTYTVGASDAARASGQIPVDCTLHDSSGNTVSTFFGFTDGNTVSIQPNGSGTGTTTDTGGGTGTTTDTGTGNGSGNGTGTTTATSTDGTIGGNVTGGVDSSPGYLKVDSIEQVRGTAVAGGGYDNGWAWIFRVTVPSDEPTLHMKFNDWTNADGVSKLGTAYDMRISSAQAQSADRVTITEANSYSQGLTITGDLDPNTPGRQIEVMVEMQVPLGTVNGSYSTTYGIESL